MILSDREIQAAVERGAIRINPLPGQENWSSTALDLTLDERIQVWKPIGGAGPRPWSTRLVPTSTSPN